jgi:hypothetical protein
LVYIYTNSRLFYQRPDIDPIHYYNDNIFLKDSDHDSGVVSDKNNDSNVDDGDQGHGSDNGEKEHYRQYSLIGLENIHYKNPFDWNKIDNEVANGVYRYVVVRPVGNMHVNEGQYASIKEHSYN